MDRGQLTEGENDSYDYLLAGAVSVISRLFLYLRYHSLQYMYLEKR